MYKRKHAQKNLTLNANNLLRQISLLFKSILEDSHHIQAARSKANVFGNCMRGVWLLKNMDTWALLADTELRWSGAGSVQ